MSGLDSLFDRYSLLARQRPAFLMLFPVAVAVLVIFPSLQAWWTTLLAVVAACGVALALGEFAQGRGKVLELGLFATWGGMPSTVMLRHDDARVDVATKSRYKAFLETRVVGLRFPTESDERKNQSGADAAYSSASAWLRSQTRDTKKFSLLFRQNIGYGFRRNLLGLRPYGIAVATASLFATAATTWMSAPQVAPAIIVSVLVSAGVLAFWLFAVTPGWVKIAAEAYAFELLAACDALAASSPKSKATKL